MLIPTLSLHVLEADVVVVGDRHLDAVDGQGAAGADRDDVGQQAGGLFFVDLALVNGGKGLDACQRPFQLADVLLHLVGDEGQDLFGDKAADGAELGLEDRQPGLEVGGLDVRQEPGLEARPEAVLQRRDLLWRPVG